MDEISPIKSWFGERYPMHSCPQCQLEHVRIPHIVVGDAPLIPVEVLNVVEVPVQPGGNTPLDTPARVMALSWSLPGDRHVQFYDILYLN